MGNCVPEKDVSSQELAKKRRSQEIQRLQSMALQEADKTTMKKHRERLMNRLSPPKRSSFSQEQLKITLNGIFDKYDTDRSGTIDMKEFQYMMNQIAFKKTGDKKRYSQEDIKMMFFRLCASQKYEITREEFYNIYKKV